VVFTHPTITIHSLSPRHALVTYYGLLLSHPVSWRAKSVVESVVVLPPSLSKRVAKWESEDEARGGWIIGFGKLVGLGRIEFHATARLK
jgi:hypothetical protein